MTTVEQTAIKCLAGKLSGVFVDKSGNMHQLHGVEDFMWIFLDVKTDAITYVKELNSFVKGFIPTPRGMEFKAFLSKIRHSVPKSWEEYCKNYKGKWYCVSVMAEIIEGETYSGLNSGCAQNVLPSKELAEAFIAMMQLMSLRQAWIGEWKPDWTNKYSVKYCICYEFNFDTKEMEVSVRQGHVVNCAFAFPSEKMAKEFYDCFKSLFEQAKPLL